MNHTARISLYFLLMFGALSVHFNYFQVFLRENGFTFGQIGVLQAILPLVAMVTSPLWGIVADALSDPRRLLRWLLVLGPLSYAVVFLGDRFWVFAALSALLALFYQPILPIHDSLALRAVHRYGGDYGRMRIWGSLGFTLPAFILPFWWENPREGPIDWRIPALVFLVYSILAWGSSWLFPKVPPDRKHGLSLAGFRLFANPMFLTLVVCNFLARWASSSMEGYQTLYFEDIGVPVRYLALFTVLGPFSEIVTILYAQRWMARFGAYRLMTVCLAVLVFRLLVMAFCADLTVLVLLQLTHALTFGLLYVVTILTVNQLAGDAIRSSAQTLNVIFSNYFARLAGLVVGGWIADTLGLPRLFLISAGIALLSLALWLVFFRDTAETHLERGVR
jgi:PPP family 3-phenylpropionic acid transporter